MSLAEALFRHVDLLAGVIGVRHPEKAGTMAAAAEYIADQFHSMGFEVSRESFPVRVRARTDSATTSVDNLLMTIPGQSKPEEILIIGAHYDSTLTTPGADDNASAIAVLIETARLLREHTPSRTIRFAAFACEEAPYFHTGEMGSLVHAEGCCNRNEQIVGMLCLEMMGFYTDAPESQQLPPTIPRWLRWLFPSKGNFLAAVSNPRSWKLCWRFRRGFRKATRFPLFPIVLPESIPEIHLSDHRGFWVHNYPALMLTDTSFLRNPHYHQPSDTPDTLDYTRMAEVTQGIAGAVRFLTR